ncbi:MAG TPA: hypothetical protein VGR76_17395 [Candidatus Angelobacter sp.]|jgi:hypothetical protein|nr:hypothetical protein [Candidatus Angelobacter sp.]
MALDYTAWLKRLRDIAAALSSRPIDVQLKIGEPFSPDEMQNEESYFAGVTGQPGFKFHESLRALYMAARSVSFRWQTRTGGGLQPLFGGMELAPLALLYEGDPELNLPEPWYGKWRTLDGWSAVTQVVLRFSQSGIASLAFRSTEGGTESIRPLEISVDEYFDLSLAACCIDGWPLLFASNSNILSPEHIEDLYAALKEISPPADLASLRRRRMQFDKSC